MEGKSKYLRSVLVGIAVTWKLILCKSSFIHLSLKNDHHNLINDLYTLTKYSCCYIEDITRWREDMNFIFEWQNNISYPQVTV